MKNLAIVVIFCCLIWLLKGGQGNKGVGVCVLWLCVFGNCTHFNLLDNYRSPTGLGTFLAIRYLFLLYHPLQRGERL